MNARLSELLRPSSQKVRARTLEPSSLSSVAMTLSLTGFGPTKIPAVVKSSRVALKATTPPSLTEVSKANESNRLAVEAIVVRSSPLPRRISSVSSFRTAANETWPSRLIAGFGPIKAYRSSSTMFLRRPSALTR